MQKIESKIKGSLQNCQIKDNWPQYDSFKIHVESLGKEIIKHKKEWLDIPDVFSIFYDLVYDSIKENTDKDEVWEGNMWNLLGETKGNRLVESIVDYIISIPRSYDIYIPLPKVKGELISSIQLSENITLEVFKDKKQVPGEYTEGLAGVFFNSFHLNQLYFKQSMEGFCRKRLENYIVKKALNNFKILLLQGKLRGLFLTDSEDKVEAALPIGLYKQEIRKVSLISVDKTSDSTKIFDIELPLDFSKFMANVDFDWDGDLLIQSKDNGGVEQSISNVLKKAVELIECNEVEAKRVQSANLWCLDSYTVENQTLAFLQVCIGIEALLGDDNYNGALTEKLADRCAFLIANNIKGRKTIREDFIELYNVRSKLVHGNAIELNAEQKKHLHWGKTILEYAILKEVKNLNLGNSRIN